MVADLELGFGSEQFKRYRTLGGNTWGEVVHAMPPMLSATIEDIRGRVGGDVQIKPKPLIKFGRRINIPTGVDVEGGYPDGKFVPIMTLQGAQEWENLPTGNLIDSVCSTSEADAGKIIGYEMQELRDGNKTWFFPEQVQLDPSDGRVAVSLPRAAYRASRAGVADGTFDVPSVPLVGTVSFFQSAIAGGVTDGVPNNDNSVNLIIPDGEQGTQKLSTSFSHRDAAILVGGEISMLHDAANKNDTATVDIEIFYRNVGGVWKRLGIENQLTAADPKLDLGDTANGPFWTFLPQSDFFVCARTDVSGVTVSGHLVFMLLELIDLPAEP